MTRSPTRYGRLLESKRLHVSFVQPFVIVTLTQREVDRGVGRPTHGLQFARPLLVLSRRGVKVHI